MKKITLGAERVIPAGDILTIEGDVLEKVVREILANNIAKELLDAMENKDNEEIITERIEASDKMFGVVHSVELTVVNRKELEKLEKEKEKIERENIELKAKVKKYESIGLGEVLEAMGKVEIVTEFAEKLQALTEEFDERMNG